MNIIKFIKSLFVNEQPVTITETTTLTTTAAPVVLTGEAHVVPKRKKVIKRKK